LVYIDAMTELYSHFSPERLALPETVYACDRKRNEALYSSLGLTSRVTAIARPEGFVSSES
jgi:hypothetical protein|tara:strand:+ start:113 stop:295 length:183 start_codon:yes stop_codon:yes gene_type:complete